MMIIANISFHFDYFPLLVVAAIAWGTPVLMSLLRLKRIPTVIVEIILGYFIGRYVLTSAGEESHRILQFLGLTGFIFLMFLSGLEIDVNKILSSFPGRRITYRRFLRNPLLVGLVYFGFSVVLAVTAALLLAKVIDISHVFYFALIMVTTSVGIVVPVLKQRGEIKNQYGQMIVTAAAVSDILGIVLFTIAAFVIRNGFQGELFYIGALFAVFILFYLLGSRLKKLPFLKNMVFQLSHAAAQIQIRGSILLIMLFVVLAQFMGNEAVLLGAFLIGLVVSSLLHHERSVMLLKLDGMGYGFFIPIFFIMVGAEFDPSALNEFDRSLIPVLLLMLGAIFAVKVIPSLLWRQVFGMRRAMAGGFLMSSMLSLIIAAAAIGLEMGIITPGINAAFIIMAMVTCFLSPVLFNWIAPSDMKGGEKTFIVGGSQTAVLLARRLAMNGRKAVIIESDETRAKDILSKGLYCMHGSGLDASLYRRLDLQAADFVIVETGLAERNQEICTMLRNEMLHDNIITRSSTSAIENKLKNLGVTTIDVTGVLATTIENLILRPATYHALLQSFENFSVEEILITNRKVDGLQVKEIPFHKDAILIMVKRDKTFFIPHGETYFRRGDILHVFGTNTAMQDTRDKVGRE